MIALLSAGGRQGWVRLTNKEGLNHRYEPQGKPMDPCSAAERRGIIPSDGGVLYLPTPSGLFDY
jgi:hypothetical protein